jgi:hypothetical protein
MLDPAGRTEDSVRHALKESFRSRVLARTRTTLAGAARTEAESLLELRRMTANLNSADRGSLTEAWYAARREGLVAHPEMLPERNPGAYEAAAAGLRRGLDGGGGQVDRGGARRAGCRADQRHAGGVL